jgi:hypothetical protein
MKTIVALGHKKFGDQSFAHGEEIPPDLLSAEQADWEFDHKSLVEYDPDERRSLYRLFAPFSGAKEKQQLDREELAEFALPQ